MTSFTGRRKWSGGKKKNCLERNKLLELHIWWQYGAVRMNCERFWTSIFLWELTGCILLGHDFYVEHILDRNTESNHILFQIEIVTQTLHPVNLHRQKRHKSLAIHSNHPISLIKFEILITLRSKIMCFHRLNRFTTQSPKRWGPFVHLKWRKEYKYVFDVQCKTTTN